MYEPDHILRILEARMSELGVTQVELGRRAFGHPDNTAIQSLKKGSSPAMDRVAAMAGALGLECYLGMPRDGSLGFNDPGTPGDIGKVEALRTGYLPIPWHVEASSIGSSPIAFHRKWLVDNALLPDNLSAVPVDQVLIAGSASTGTVAIVDSSAHRRGKNGLYAFRRDSANFLGFLTFARGVTVIAQVDPEAGVDMIFPDDERPIRLFGPVIWSGQIWR
jgi:hypothetical protein